MPQDGDSRLLHDLGSAHLGGFEGEVCVAGPCVTAGYLMRDHMSQDPNIEAFSLPTAPVGRMLRTGDKGYVDADGYLQLVGRFKEIINRGGEKIAPKEVDDVLMDHPAVAQAVTFAMAHASLGEEVAAAVVAVDGAEVDAATLRKFCGERLAAFKVPREIVVVPEIPKGPTGKLQRIGLAKALGLE